MTPFEWIAVAYFAALTLAAPRAARRVLDGGARRGLAWVAGAVALVILARFTMPWPVRAWMPHAYLVLGYWIPAAFVPAATNERFERWLAQGDVRLAFLTRVRLPEMLLELAYLCCYPLVPAAFFVVFVLGSAEDVEQFWIAVLTAGYVCYASLPWTAARPPRLAATGDSARRGVAKVNAEVLGRLSHQLVTFPSGHVAVSIAAAVAVAPVSTWAGGLIGVVAILIAVAAVAGRYHYALDVVLGLLAGVLVPVIAGRFF
jgi:membrane-associated phospholipid phosphatase